LRSLVELGFGARSPAELADTGEIKCLTCGSEHVVLASSGDALGGPPALLRHRHSPPGQIAVQGSVEITQDAGVVFIPYGDDGKADRFPFVNLREMPRALPMLPEVERSGRASRVYGGRNSLFRLLADLNASPAALTIGCDWRFEGTGSFVRCSGYVDLSSSPLQENTRASTARLASHLATLVQETASGTLVFSFGIKMAIFELRPIYIVQARVEAAAKTKKGAFLHWETGLRTLRRALQVTVGEKDSDTRE
jgi:hypothetical protein